MYVSRPPPPSPPPVETSLSPIGVDGIGSPLTPSMFHAPAGLQVRAHRASVDLGRGGTARMDESAYAQAAANPWGAAASNPFPMSQNGAGLNYYTPPVPKPIYAQTASVVPSAAAAAPTAHTRVQYDPQSSSFLIPTGAGFSPPPLNAPLSSSHREAKLRGMRLRENGIAFKSLVLDKRRVMMIAAVAAVVVTCIIVALMMRGRSSIGRGGEGQQPVASRVIEDLSRESARGARGGDESWSRNFRQKGSEETAAAVTPTPPPPPRDASESSSSSQLTSGRSGDSGGLVAKGLSELSKLKANLASVSQRVQSHVSDHAAAAKAKLNGISARHAAKRQRTEETRQVEEEEEQESAEEEEDDDAEDADMAIGSHLKPIAKSRDPPDDERHPASSLKEPNRAHSFDHDHSIPVEPARPPPSSPVASSSSSDRESYDWFTSEWSVCSVSCGTGVQTRTLICQHARTGSRVSNRLCTLNEPPPIDVRPCEMEACHPDKPITTAGTSQRPTPNAVEVEVDEEQPGGRSSTVDAVERAALVSDSPRWPLLADYTPPFSSVPSAACTSKRWGLSFVEDRWLSTGDLQCGVDLNADEHASVELIRFPDENLPAYTDSRTAEQVAAEQRIDSFFLVRHGLFHPTAVRYATSSQSAVTKEHIDKNSSGAAVGTPDWAISLDCTAVAALKSRVHVDANAALFLESLHFLNPHSPPLVTPSDPTSHSIFTRAFDRLTDDEFDTTTIMMHRNCEPPFSAAQCTGDIFAVYAIAHTLKVEFSSLRLIFLDSFDETPFFPVWERLVGSGRVFTRQMWADLRVPPFDENDVYLTNAVYIVPTMVPTLISLGEAFLATGKDGSSSSSVRTNECDGPSALHQGFNSLVSDLILGPGTSASTGAQRAHAVRTHLNRHTGKSSASSQQAHDSHVHPSLVVLAQGTGTVPVLDAATSTHHRHTVKLHHSGAQLTQSADLIRSVLHEFPSVKLQNYPSQQSFLTQLQMMTHAQVLIATTDTIAFNTMMFISHPETLHVVEITGRDAENTPEKRMRLHTSRGTHIVSSDGRDRWRAIAPNSDAVFSGRWICMRLGCASYELLLSPGDGAAVTVSPSQVISSLRRLSPPLPTRQTSPEESAEPQLEEFDAPPTESRTAFQPPTIDRQHKAPAHSGWNAPIRDKVREVQERSAALMQDARREPPVDDDDDDTSNAAAGLDDDDDLQEPAASRRAIEGWSHPPLATRTLPPAKTPRAFATSTDAAPPSHPKRPPIATAVPGSPQDESPPVVSRLQKQYHKKLKARAAVGKKKHS